MCLKLSNHVSRPQADTPMAVHNVARSRGIKVKVAGEGEGQFRLYAPLYHC